MNAGAGSGRYARGMKILAGTHTLRDVELHLTDSEARRLIDAIADRRHDLAEVGMSESHVPLRDGETEVMFFVYAAKDELEAEVIDRRETHLDQSRLGGVFASAGGGHSTVFPPLASRSAGRATEAGRTLIPDLPTIDVRPSRPCLSRS